MLFPLEGLYRITAILSGLCVDWSEPDKDGEVMNCYWLSAAFWGYFGGRNLNSGPETNLGFWYCWLGFFVCLY